MKKLIVVLALGICMATSVVGCSNKNNDTDTNENTKVSKESVVSDKIEEAESTTVEIKETTETKKDEDVTTIEQTEAIDDNEECDLPIDANSMTSVAHALALFESESGMAYSYNNPDYFWGSLSYLMAGFGMQSAAAGNDAEGNLTLPTIAVKEFAAASFAEYDGNLQELPAIPDTVSVIEYDSENDCYATKAVGFGATTVEATGCEKTPSGYGVTIELKTNDGQSVGSWRMDIKETSFTGSGHPLLNYTVEKFTKL